MKYLLHSILGIALVAGVACITWLMLLAAGACSTPAMEAGQVQAEKNKSLTGHPEVGIIEFKRGDKIYILAIWDHGSRADIELIDTIQEE